MSGTRLTPWDPSEHLRDEEDIQAYLEAVREAVREENDPGLEREAQRVIARARRRMESMTTPQSCRDDHEIMTLPKHDQRTEERPQEETTRKNDHTL